ncbi:hypothetical protein K438DRAFT_1778375 [Mycena galopus ATCC 62051]|nr:hypothetical protein K438DRAFT_1778375 [Mycena galopus ATCC 62051]
MSTSVYVRWTAFTYLRLPSATSVGLPSARSARSVYLRLDQSTSAVVRLRGRPGRCTLGLRRRQTLDLLGGERSDGQRTEATARTWIRDADGGYGRRLALKLGQDRRLDSNEHAVGSPIVPLNAERDVGNEYVLLISPGQSAATISRPVRGETDQKAKLIPDVSSATTVTVSDGSVVDKLSKLEPFMLEGRAVNSTSRTGKTAGKIFGGDFGIVVGVVADDVDRGVKSKRRIMARHRPVYFTLQLREGEKAIGNGASRG